MANLIITNDNNDVIAKTGFTDDGDRYCITCYRCPDTTDTYDDLFDAGRAAAHHVDAEHGPGSLPVWQNMSDLDKGCALMHMWKRESEGAEYAVENYPCRYLDHPALRYLDGDDASDHAASFADDAAALSEGESERLYELALAASEKSGTVNA